MNEWCVGDVDERNAINLTFKLHTKEEEEKKKQNRKKGMRRKEKLTRREKGETLEGLNLGN
jgi:hypothetical protein